MQYILALLSGVVGSFNSLSMRLYQTRYQHNQLDLRFFQILSLFVSMLFYLFISGFQLPSAPAAWILTVCFSLCITFSFYASAEYMRCGPMSLGAVIVSCNVIIPIIVGVLFYNETLRFVSIIGIGLLLAMLILSSYSKGEAKREMSLRWYILVLLCFLGNGCGSLCLNGYASLSLGNNNGFLAASYGLSALTMFAYYFYKSFGNRKKRHTPKFSPVSILLVIISGLAGGCVNFLLLFLNQSMNASILYPLYNSSIAIMVSLTSCIVFHERLTLRKALSIVIGIIAVICLNL